MTDYVMANSNPFALFAALYGAPMDSHLTFRVGRSFLGDHASHVVVMVNETMFGFKPSEARAVADMIALVIERFEKIPQEEIDDYTTVIIALRDQANFIDRHNKEKLS